MRSIWSGALTFGLVNIPVRLHSAVQSKERVSFRLLHKTDLSPIKYERVCEKEGEAVDWKEIVKGYEYAKGKFVVLTDDDFKAAAIESSKTIEIMREIYLSRDGRTHPAPRLLASQRLDGIDTCRAQRRNQR